MDPSPPSTAAVAAVALIANSFKRRSSCAEQQSAPPAATTATTAAASPHQLLDLRPLNGLRALASIFVVAFHSWLMWGSLAPADTVSQLTRHHALVSAASIGGPLAVDFFLLLTGMLAAWQLVPALEGSADSWRAVRSYWRRRSLRVLPAYLATNAVLLLALPLASPEAPEAALARSIFVGRCPAGIWRNLTFTSNCDFGNACGEAPRSGCSWCCIVAAPCNATIPSCWACCHPLT